MNLAIFLALGDSFTDMRKTGQDVQFRKYYLPTYSAKFDKIYIFSYENEKIANLPKNIQVVPNISNMHRYFYALVIPFIHREKLRDCDIIRAYHVTGTVPAIISKIVFNKNFVFNFAFNYKKFARLDKKYFQLLLLYLLEPLAFLFASKIFIANKKYLKASKKYVYLPNGVDTNLFKPQGKKQNEKIMRILSVGRLKKQKNFLALIEALSGLKVQLTIVGRGPLKEGLEKRAQKLKISLRLLESVPNNKMPSVYSSANIFVLPSLIEGHPKSLLEAMSCSLPVVCTNVEGSNEIIEDNVNGLITQPTHSGLREAIEKLLSSRNLRKRLSTKAREDTVKNFNLSDLIQKETNTIKSIK